MRGQIDRVDLLPFDEKMTLVDESGSCEIAPLRLEGSDWKPRRQIIIRDIKTSEGEPHKRHRIGLLEELQLALYARAWEVAHPGDLVVAVGISVIGHDTDHFLEVSRNIADGSTNLAVGDTRKPQTPSRYRFPDEDQEPTSDPFRAWLAQRLSTASAAAGAEAGRVHPTPSKGACQFCSVQSVCNVATRGTTDERGTKFEQEIILNTGQRLALNLDAHIVIDAGAGTGKTMTIVQRVIQHYLDQDQRATRIPPKPERPRSCPAEPSPRRPQSERIYRIGVDYFQRRSFY